jgi:cytochrome c
MAGFICLISGAAEAQTALDSAASQAATDTPQVQAAADTPQAQAAPDLAKDKLCLSCHSVDAKLVGPPYRDVASKYRGQPDAEAMLIAKVIAGGKDVWGNDVMPPSDLTDDEARVLVQWVLSQ